MWHLYKKGLYSKYTNNNNKLLLFLPLLPYFRFLSLSYKDSCYPPPHLSQPLSHPHFHFLTHFISFHFILMNFSFGIILFLKNLDIDFYVRWLGFVILDLESFTTNFYSSIIAIIVLNGCIITFISRMSVGPTFPFWSSGIISSNQSFLVSVKFSYNFITWFGIFIIWFFFPIGCKSFLRIVQYYFIC